MFTEKQKDEALKKLEKPLEVMGKVGAIRDRWVKIIIRVMYSIFLLLACYMVYDFLQDMSFAQGDLQRWQDARATVTASRLTYEDLSSERKNKKEIKRYTVRYTYEAEFNAWGKLFDFEYNGTNSGETDKDAVTIPERAYNFPQQGGIVRVIFDPDAEGSYRIGSKEHWRRKGEVSLDNLMVPIIFFVVALIFLVVDFSSAKKRRAAENS